MTDLEYIYIEPTTYCNLHCLYCNRDEVVGEKSVHMSLDTLTIILDKLRDYPINEIKLHGLGDPFMHPKYPEFLEKFNIYFPGCFVVTSTNCQYKPSNRFFEALKFIDLLYLSIDGFQETYERLRPPAKWDKLIRFLDILQARKDEWHGCDITVNYVVTRDNIQDIEKLDKLRQDYGLGELRLNIAHNWSENEKCEHVFSEDDIQVLMRYKHAIKGRAPWTYSDCFWPVKGLYFDAMGGVKVCPMNTSTEPLGNILVQSVEEIRRSPHFVKIREGCARNEPDAHCLNCSYKELSPLLARFLGDSIDGESQSPIFHRKAKTQLLRPRTS